MIFADTDPNQALSSWVAEGRDLHQESVKVGRMYSTDDAIALQVVSI
jgi:hypothetical protein